MKITDVAIKYRTTALVLTALLVIGGLYAYVTIPKEAQPSIEIPNIIVTTVYPGASPDDIESLITQKIEQEIQGISGIKEIRSTSTEGVSSIVVEFEPDVKMDDAYQKVRDKVSTAESDLPTDLQEEPIVSEIDLSETPIMSVNLAAPYGIARLKEVAEDLQDEIEAIPSVLEVDLIGALDREVQVNVDLARLQGYNLAFDDLVKAISGENANIPGGSVDVDRENYLVRVNGQFSDPAEINDVVVKAPGGRPIYVRDVATVDFGFKKRESYARLEVLKIKNEDGSYTRIPAQSQRFLEVITLNVKKRSGENILETAGRVRELLDSTPFPQGTQVTVTGDQSENIDTLVKDLENNIIAGLIFVVTVLLFFLGVRNATLVGVAIPLSMLISFIVLQALGYTLNFIILFSLIIALGMLVDNAIVIVENIYRFREEGYGRFEAARLGTKEVAIPVTTSTLTTLAAFAPMLLWPGIIGKFMSYMPLTLIITLTSSLVVALVFNPVLTGVFIRLEGEEAPRRTRAARITAYVLVAFVAAIVLLVNWKTFVVLALLIPALYFLHTRVMVPIANRFMTHTLPRGIAAYRRFLEWMLYRDYSARRALLRNSLAMSLFTVGFLVLVVGGLVAMLSRVGGIALAALGGLLLVAGVLGIFAHTLESLYLGGKTTVKAGLIFGGVMLAILAAMYFSPKEVHLAEIAELMALPAIVVAVGALGWVLGSEKRQTLILTDNRARLLTGTLGALFSIVILFALVPTGTEFFPTTDPNQVIVTLENALGTTLETSNATAEQGRARIEALLADDPDDKENVKDVLVNVGVGGDALFGGGSASPERSRITLNMVDYGDRAVASTGTLARLREQLQGIPGADITIDQDQGGPPTGKPVNIEITGPEFAEIQHIARDIKAQMQRWSETGEIPGLVDVQDNLNAGRPELQVRVDRARAAQFGLSTQKVAQTVRAAINGAETGKYRDGEDEYDITVRLAENERQSLESIRNLTILDEGQQVPLTAVATLETAGGLGSITRLDLERVVTVTGDAAPGANGNAILAQVQARLDTYQKGLPPGYALSYTGASEEQAESFSFLTTVLLIAVALIFMIMVAQFNSVSAPFIIMVAVGLSLTGVLLGLILTRTPFGLMTFIGVISLAGIVVNNGIVLIDYTMQLRDRGLTKHDAIIEAGATRLRPVLLTALTTVIGLVPLTFGINFDFVGLLTAFDPIPGKFIGSENTQFWGPMGTSIIAGLTFGTFLTLVIVPVMYSTFDSVAMRVGRLLTGHDVALAHHLDPDDEPEGDGVPTDGFVPVGQPTREI